VSKYVFASRSRLSPADNWRKSWTRFGTSDASGTCRLRIPRDVDPFDADLKPTDLYFEAIAPGYADAHAGWSD